MKRIGCFIHENGSITYLLNEGKKIGIYNPDLGEATYNVETVGDLLDNNCAGKTHLEQWMYETSDVKKEWLDEYTYAISWRTYGELINRKEEEK